MAGTGQNRQVSPQLRRSFTMGPVKSGPLQRTAATVTVVTCSIFVLGCGSSGLNHQARQLENASVLSTTAPLSDRLVKQSEIAAASDAAANRTFLQLWSLLQFQAWDQAMQLFEPGLRNALGPSLLAQALEDYVTVWQGTKPRILTSRATGDKALITFMTRNEAGGLVPASISFQRINGSWLVYFFSLLDPAIQRTVQLRVQAQIDPLATKPSPEAVRQGLAAVPLQSDYLERKLRAEAKERPRRAGGA
jgi:hypothetical protein